MLKLKHQYFGHLMQGTDSLEKTLMLGKIQGRRRRGWQRMRWLDGSPTQWTWVWVNSRSWWWTGKPGVLQSVGLRKSWTWLGNWTKLNWCKHTAYWKSPWCWERLRAEGDEGIRGWDGWTASPMQWTWTWVNSRRWWGTGRPGMLQSMGSQKSRTWLGD